MIASTMKQRPLVHTLSNQQRAAILDEITAVLVERNEIVFAFVHGSFLTGTFFRDIDLGLYVDGVGRADYWDYEAELARAIEGMTGNRFPVEPKIINTAPLSFCYHVIRGKILLVRDELFLESYMVRVARAYLEMAPVRRRYLVEAMS